MKRSAVQFGAGNIGRGFLGQLYRESEYSTVFIDVAPELIQLLNSRRAYPLRIVGDTNETLSIDCVSALHVSQRQEIAEALTVADIASTAVGVSALRHVAPLIADGIAIRADRTPSVPLNIIVCENLIEAGDYLREEVRKHLARETWPWMDESVGFVEASIGRMVPVMTDAMKSEDPLLVCAEPYCELPVDACGFKGEIPAIKHLNPKENFSAYVERKLFVHNAGHAVTAYLGYLRGYEFIWQAIADREIRFEADSAMQESCAGLVSKHGLSRPELDEHVADLIRRFGNRALGDQIARVAKDPVRKLGRRDRLVGAAQLCVEQGITPNHLAFAAAAAIRYDHPADEAARSLQALYSSKGMGGVLAEICGIEPNSPLAALIDSGMQRLARDGWTN